MQPVEKHETAEAPILQVDSLTVHFPVRRGIRWPGRTRAATACIKAVDGVSFQIPRGRTLGLVGESGCGKTTLSRALLRLIPATAGRVVFEDTDILGLAPREMRAMRRNMQIVFQDPAGSLNPRMNIETILGEALHVHGLVKSAAQRRDRVASLLQRVGLSPDQMPRYPHEFSGGQRQRIVIARALSLEPRFIICDEPVSALDVSIQSQILNLLSDLQRDLNLTYLFIAHNLAVVRHISHEVAVMYFGKIVEHAPVDDLFSNPRHPYTQALLAAAPDLDPAAFHASTSGATSESDRRSEIGRGSSLHLQSTIKPVFGEPPSPLNPPSGCAFHPRCPLAAERCKTESPELTVHNGLSDNHLVACHFASPIL